MVFGVFLDYLLYGVVEWLLYREKRVRLPPEGVVDIFIMFDSSPGNRFMNVSLVSTLPS